MLPIQNLPSERCWNRNYTICYQRTINLNMAWISTKETYARLPLTTVLTVLTLMTASGTYKTWWRTITPMIPNRPPTKSTGLLISWPNAHYPSLLACCCWCINLILPHLQFLGLQIQLHVPSSLHKTKKGMMIQNVHKFSNLCSQHIMLASLPHLLYFRILREKYAIVLNLTLISATISEFFSSIRYSRANCWTSIVSKNSLLNLAINSSHDIDSTTSGSRS